MQDTQQTNSSSKKWTYPVLLGITISASFAGQCSFPRTKSGLSSDIERLLSISSNITEDGTIVNGAWLARNADDQDFIDASRHVYSATFFGADLGYHARELLSKTVDEIISGLADRRNILASLSNEEAESLQTALVTLSKQLQAVKSQRGITKFPMDKKDRQTLSSSLEKMSSQLRYTDQIELQAVYEQNQRDVERISFLGMPEF